MPVLEVKNVYKSMGRRRILSDVSFAVRSGEILGFLGPNGAGKTTTIKIILGMLSADKGEISVNGESVVGNYENAIKCISGIVENPDLYGYLSGYNNLKLFADLRGVKEEKIREAVALVGLTNRINDKVSSYSLGMKQRLGVALAILHEPKVMILDEPTNGLDPAGIKELRDNLKYLAHEKGMSIVVSSHLLSEMQLMCDRVVIIDGGKIVGSKALTENGDESLHNYAIQVSDVIAAKECLKEYGEIAVTEDTVNIHIKKNGLNKVLLRLIEKEIGIYSCTLSGNDLEASFMEMTKGGGKIE